MNKFMSSHLTILMKWTYSQKNTLSKMTPEKTENLNNSIRVKENEFIV